MKHLFITSFFLLLSFAQTESKIYTGFNYGAFWTVESNVKKKADFLDGFNLAKSLTVDIPFDSARLFTCKATGTLNEPTEAFDAAVESNTNLLLGFWITPGEKGDSPDKNVKNEMAALEKGFKKHGHALADLIIGLAVGSEDVYRAEEAGELGVTAEVVGKTIAQVKNSIAESSFAEYMKDKPIGHVDTAKYAVVDNADFIGMTAYPYWNKDSIDTTNESFHASLEDVKKRAGNRPVWIAEMGWPSTDTEQHGAAVAGFDELQRFWNEVGCSVFGKYTTFWYELLRDSTLDQRADWGLIDIPSVTRTTTIVSPSTAPFTPSAWNKTSFITVIVTETSTRVVDVQRPLITTRLDADHPHSLPAIAGSLVPSLSATSPKPTSTYATENTAYCETLTITPSPTPTSMLVNWCVTVADIDRNGYPVIVAGGPAAPNGECSSPPTFTGFPYAPKSEPAALVTSSSLPDGRSWCIAMADVDGNGQMVPVDASATGFDGQCSDLSINSDAFATTVATDFSSISQFS